MLCFKFSILYFRVIYVVKKALSNRIKNIWEKKVLPWFKMAIRMQGFSGTKFIQTSDLCSWNLLINLRLKRNLNKQKSLSGIKNPLRNLSHVT